MKTSLEPKGENDQVIEIGDFVIYAYTINGEQTLKIITNENRKSLVIMPNFNNSLTVKTSESIDRI